MTHDPCRYACCIPPTAREAVERAKEGLRMRKRRLLDAITEAAAWDRPISVAYTDQDALAELIDDGLVVHTVGGYRPHPM